MSGPLDAHPVTTKVKTLINTQLKTVLKREGLPVSGVKATLQERIIARTLFPILLSLFQDSSIVDVTVGPRPVKLYCHEQSRSLTFSSSSHQMSTTMYGEATGKVSTE